MAEVTIRDHAFDMPDDDDGECPNCAGEGWVSGCFSEYACVDPEEGCDLCMRRCDWCAPIRKAEAV